MSSCLGSKVTGLEVRGEHERDKSIWEGRHRKVEMMRSAANTQCKKKKKINSAGLSSIGEVEAQRGSQTTPELNNKWPHSAAGTLGCSSRCCRCDVLNTTFSLDDLEQRILEGKYASAAVSMHNNIYILNCT